MGKKQFCIRSYFIRSTPFSCFVCISIFMLFILFINSNAMAWQEHSQMTEEAIDIMPSASFPPVENGGRYLGNLLVGSTEPDRNRVISHINVPQCAWMINKLAKQCEEMIRNGKDWDKIFFKMGQATHYIQDLNSPHHGIGRYIKGDHEDFEAIASWGYWEPEKFDGFHYISNYKTFAYNAARFSARYIYFADRLNDNDMQFQEYKTYHKELMTPLWDHSVNDIIDLWLTILKNGLGEEKYKELVFAKQVGVRAEEKIKFTKINEVSHIKAGAATCFIATAVYGSSWEEHVVTLRQFREKWLLSNSPGKWFVEVYYSLSPLLAEAIADRPWARTISRLALTPVVVLAGASLGNMGYICLIFISFITIGSIMLFIRKRL